MNRIYKERNILERAIKDYKVKASELEKKEDFHPSYKQFPGLAFDADEKYALGKVLEQIADNYLVLMKLFLDSGYVKYTKEIYLKVDHEIQMMSNPEYRKQFEKPD